MRPAMKPTSIKGAHMNATRSLLLCAAAVIAAGCSQSKGDIVRVQPNVTKKSDLIDSNFDIQREYDPKTGETTNVISENKQDRVWNEREFIRVDWSANQLNKFAGLSYGAVSNPLNNSSNSSWVQPNEKVDDIQDL